MQVQTGSNFQDVKLRNRLLVLQLIAVYKATSRVDLAKATGLSKMTVGNIVSELIADGLVDGTETTEPATGSYGRKPIVLRIAAHSPCICGMLIKRGLCQIVLAELGGTVIEQADYPYSSLDSAQDLIEILCKGFRALGQRTSRKIIAVGISSLGPIDSETGTILSPPYFYGIENVPIAAIIEENTGLPTFLVNDANAGALAEKMFGSGQPLSNFIYLHIMNGIGAGFVLHDQLYIGDTGQSGEIGHTSINFSGPPCACGNTGCLDLYANIDLILRRIDELSPLYPRSGLAGKRGLGWLDIVHAGDRQDYLAVTVLEEFCSYIAYSLINSLNLLDLSHIIVGYDSISSSSIIETILQQKISKAVMSSGYRRIAVTHSSFGGNAPLIGAIANIANMIFTMKLPLRSPV